jgi:hypothetical protein
MNNLISRKQSDFNDSKYKETLEKVNEQNTLKIDMNAADQDVLRSLCDYIFSKYGNISVDSI